MEVPPVPDCQTTCMDGPYPACPEIIRGRTVFAWESASWNAIISISSNIGSESGGAAVSSCIRSVAPHAGGIFFPGLTFVGLSVDWNG